MSARRVFVAGNREKARVIGAADELARLLGERVTLVGQELDGEASLAHIEADLLVVLGGDGALLSAARRLDGNPVPVLGINFGKLGFLAPVRAREIAWAAEQLIIGGAFVVSPRMMLEATVYHGDGRVDGPHRALNDAVVERWDARSVSIDVCVSGQPATTYRGDGVIVATPTGSTAHSLAAGGPIVEPGLQAFVLTPMCSHSLTNRPLVLPSDLSIELTVGTGSNRIGLAVDGQVLIDLDEGDRVRVVRSEVVLNIALPRSRSYFDVLGARLHWAGQPPYEAER